MFMKNIIIREIESNEINILKDILYEAIYRPGTNSIIPQSILEMPEMNVIFCD